MRTGEQRRNSVWFNVVLCIGVGGSVRGGIRNRKEGCSTKFYHSRDRRRKLLEGQINTGNTGKGVNYNGKRGLRFTFDPKGDLFKDLWDQNIQTTRNLIGK